MAEDVLDGEITENDIFPKVLKARTFQDSAPVHAHGEKTAQLRDGEEA